MRSLSFQRLDLPVVDALGVKFAILPPSREVEAEGWSLAFQGEGGKVYQNSQALPRASLIGSVRPLRSLEELATFDPAREAFVSVPPPPDLAPGKGEVLWLGETANRIDLSVTTETPQLLLLTDAYDPGWKAYVDDRETALFPTNLGSRGVYLTPGTHRVTFSFEPASLKWGWRAMLGCLALLAVGLVWLGRRPWTPAEEGDGHE
jgi:hypothetical protein